MKAIKFGLLSLIIIGLLACGAQKAPIKVEAESDALDRLAAVVPSGKAHIASVRVYLDGYLCPMCIAPIKKTLEAEEGVKIVVENPEVNMIEIIPAGDQGIKLRDIRQRINGTRVLSVLRMEVVAAGKVVKYTQQYFANTQDAHIHDWHRLVVGEGPNNTFILAEGKKLEEVKASGYERIVAIGTVTNFFDRFPVLSIAEFKELKEP